MMSLLSFMKMALELIISFFFYGKLQLFEKRNDFSSSTSMSKLAQIFGKKVTNMKTGGFLGCNGDIVNKFDYVWKDFTLG